MPRALQALLLLHSLGSAVGMVPPNNTWGTVPIFWHSANQSGPLNAQALDFIAEHPFALVTLEKSSMLHYPPLHSSGEAKVIQQAKWIKQRAPDKAIMFCEHPALNERTPWRGCVLARLLALITNYPLLLLLPPLN